jgi:hypothetical protein
MLKPAIMQVSGLLNNLQIVWYYFKKDPKFNGYTGRGTIQGHDVRLLIPTTFMNRSGQSVVPFAKFYQIAPEAILIAHDELDMNPGVIRLKMVVVMVVTMVCVTLFRILVQISIAYALVLVILVRKNVFQDMYWVKPLKMNNN